MAEVGEKDGKYSGLQVLALGIPRTGTFSRASVLDILNLPCYHGFTMICQITSDSEQWATGLDWNLFNKPSSQLHLDPITGTPALAFWDKLFRPHKSCADLPAIIFVEELLATYPECKVVLVERDINRWYASHHAAVIANMFRPVMGSIVAIDPAFMSRMRIVSERWAGGWFHVRSQADMERNARDVYRRHYELVRRVTPGQRLLEFDLKDGWEPLCRFSGKEVPDVAFPRTNNGEALQKAINGVLIMGIRNALFKWMKIGALVGTAVLVGVWLRH